VIERCDYYSDDEFRQALQYEEEYQKEEMAKREYEQECLEESYRMEADINEN
jgi:hypothetical protein